MSDSFEAQAERLQTKHLEADVEVARNANSRLLSRLLAGLLGSFWGLTVGTALMLSREAYERITDAPATRPDLLLAFASGSLAILVVLVFYSLGSHRHSTWLWRLVQGALLGLCFGMLMFRLM